MEEPLSTILLAASMFIVGLILGLAASLLISKPQQPQLSATVVVTAPNGAPSTVTASPSCQIVINATGIYSCNGLIARLNGTLDNTTILVG
ncbi:MAG: hypothetical protein ABWJ97_00285 [Thermoproteus sp.]